MSVKIDEGKLIKGTVYAFILIGIFALGFLALMLEIFLEPREYFYSFEEDWDGWDVCVDDTDHTPGEIDWSVARSKEYAYDGDTSVKIYMDNLNDKSKIWLRHEFKVERGESYDIDLEFYIATQDSGDVNTFKIVGGVTQEEVLQGSDIAEMVIGTTDNNGGTGYKWMKKQRSFNIEANTTDTLYIVLGIWGTWETARAYYFDAITIEITNDLF